MSPDLDTHSGALFNSKGDAILPSPPLRDDAHVARFLAESAELVERATR